MVKVCWRVLAGAAILGSAAACSLIFSPGDFAGAVAADGGGDGGLPACTGISNVATPCHDFCKGLTSPAILCADFDDGGLGPTGFHAFMSDGSTSVAVDSLNASSPPASLVADWPASAPPASNAFVGRTFTLERPSQIHLSFDVVVESASDTKEAAVTELLFVPEDAANRHYLQVLADTNFMVLRQHYADGGERQRLYLPAALRVGTWGHLEIQLEISDAGQGHAKVLLDGQSAVEQDVSGPWTPVELVLGMDYAPNGYHSRLRYDNVVLDVH